MCEAKKKKMQTMENGNNRKKGADTRREIINYISSVYKWGL